MIRVCLVKQHTTYDLFTRTGPDLRSIVGSSNWRSGPLGLWEAFECSARIVFEDVAPECQIGKRHWSRYVQGWQIWPADGQADASDLVDWGQYDIVVSIDVAVPQRIVRRFPGVMWCYYFIEGGTVGIDQEFKGSPFYGYNVFLNHRMARSLLTPESPSVAQLRRTRRAVVDFPYYMQSAESIQRLYGPTPRDQRQGICLSHHSREVISDTELETLGQFGPVRHEWSSLADIHAAELDSAYFVVHPRSVPRTGTALIEAISAGCLVLAPRRAVAGFPELVPRALDFHSFDELCALLRTLQNDRELCDHYAGLQRRMVDEWCYLNPALNLVTLYEAFASSHASQRRQRCAEAYSWSLVATQRSLRSLGRRALHLNHTFRSGV